MDFCPFHKKNCEEIKMITIIELKKGKIKEIKICEDCAQSYIKETNSLSDLPDDPKELLKLILLKEECIECNIINGKELTKEQKIMILENKIAAAVEKEDYETAAIIKKQIGEIKNLN